MNLFVLNLFDDDQIRIILAVNQVFDCSSVILFSLIFVLFYFCSYFVEKHSSNCSTKFEDQCFSSAINTEKYQGMKLNTCLQYIHIYIYTNAESAHSDAYYPINVLLATFFIDVNKYIPKSIINNIRDVKRASIQEYNNNKEEKKNAENLHKSLKEGVWKMQYKHSIFMFYQLIQNRT